MSLPVSQYEALLAEVRGLRRKAQRVQQLARPLLQSNSQGTSFNDGTHEDFRYPFDGLLSHYQTDGSAEPLDYTMESLLLGRQNNATSPNYENGVLSSSAEGDTTCSEDDDFGGRGGCGSGKLSVSSEPPPHRNRATSAGRGDVASLYHGTWPVERTMWNSEPARLGVGGGREDRRQLGNHVEVTSVMSFASSSGGVPLDRVLGSPDSSKWSSQQLEAKMDVVHSLLAMLGGQEHVNMGETLLALSTCPESCLAMRQSGCIPLLVKLVQSDRDGDTRRKAGQALHNLVHSQLDEKLRKRESRVLKLLEQCKDYTEALRNNTEYEQITESGSFSSEDGDKHPVQTVAHLMKLSFDEGHRQAICLLGGIHTIASLVEVEHSMHGSTWTDSHCLLMRRYACMALTNLTFGDSGNKALLCSYREFMRALVVQLQSPSDELRQVTASVLRNLSWRADSISKEILKEVGSVTGLMKASMLDNKENTLKSILSALWNLSAHCTENKSEICAIDGALGFLVDMLTYKTPSKSLAIIENTGGILRNISSQIAVREDFRETLRQHNCLQILLDQLKSPSLTIVSNACGTLWNLSAKCAADQEALWQMGAPSMLRSLNHSKHKMIAMGSSAALKNLLSAKPQQVLQPQLDSTALSLDLPVLPTLGARKQKALLQDLDQNLSETYENIEKDSPVKKCDKDLHFQENRRKSKARPSSPEFLDEVQLSNNFASLTLNEPSTSHTSDHRLQSRIPHGYGSSSLPYLNPSISHTNPFTYIPVRNKFSDCAYEDEIDISDQPIDYSKKYSETKLPNRETDKACSNKEREYSFGKESEKETFSIYAETDLDQPTDYSLRYAEDDSDSEICDKKTEYVQDTVKTYCTEDTPYETPFNFSTATSMSDLRLDEKNIIDNDKLKENGPKINKESSENLEEKDRCSTEDISDCESQTKLVDKIPKSELSSGLLSPEKPVNYAEEGTPGYFSRVSSFGSITSIPANEKLKNTEDSEISTLESRNVPDAKPTEKVFSKTPAETKAVKFERVVNYAEETPLMFSRSSSLASLDSIEQHSIRDDRSSVVSDFSRLPSGIVSPSELPDSPTQTVPPSPKPRKTPLDFPTTSKPRPPEHSARPPPKSNVFEDNTMKFKEESTPIQFSTATSLSSLTIDDHEETNQQDSDSKLAATSGSEEESQKDEEPEKKDAEKETTASDVNDEEFVVESEDDADESILADCINIGMQTSTSRNNQVKPITTSTSSKLPLSSFKYTPQNSGAPVSRSVLSTKSSKQSFESQVGSSSNQGDTTRTYCTEDTPARLSHAGSNSDLSVLSISNDKGTPRKGGYFSDDSSNLSGENDNILAECIRSAMPKPKSEAPKPPSCLPRRHSQTAPPPKYSPRAGGNPRSREAREAPRRDNSLPPHLRPPGSRGDESERFAVEHSPCQFSLGSSLSDLTVDGSYVGLKRVDPTNPVETSTPVVRPSASHTSNVNSQKQDGWQRQQSRRESLSSLSVESLGSLEAEQALLEQCISSGMPKSIPDTRTKPLDIPESRSNQRRAMGKQQSRERRPTSQPPHSHHPHYDPSPASTTTAQQSKNANAASVAGSTPPPPMTSCPLETRIAAAGVGANRQEVGQRGTAEGRERTETPTGRAAEEEREVVAGMSPDRCSPTEEISFTDLTKSGSKKSLSEIMNTRFDDIVIEDCLAKSCDNSKTMDNRMLDPDAMIESLDRFTAELVSQASHLNKDDDKYKVSTGDNTWNEDTSPNEVTFPSISGSAPNVITFSNEENVQEDLNKVGVDVPDGVNEPSNDFSSINTSTMTDSTLIAIEASKIATVFKNEAEMSLSITSVNSLELDRVQPPSQMTSLTNSMVGPEKNLRSPKLLARKKSLPAGLMVRRALSNSLNHGSSLESLDNHSLSNLDHINPPSDFLYDMDGSMTSVASLPSEGEPRADFVINGVVGKELQSMQHPIFNVKLPFSELGDINPPSLFNEITDFCNSLADVPTDAIGSETEIFEDCNTHLADSTLQDITLAEDDQTLFSDAKSATPQQSDLSSLESTPKKTKQHTSKSMTTKQRRNLARDRYKTYTVAAEMVMREEEEKLRIEGNSESPEEYLTVRQDVEISDADSTTFVSAADSEQSKMTPKERRLRNRSRFETQVLDEAVTSSLRPPALAVPSSDPASPSSSPAQSSSPAHSPARTKLSIRRNFMQKRIDNKERFRTQTVSEVGFSPDRSGNGESEVRLHLQKEADRVLRTLQGIKTIQDDLLDCETLSLVSNDDDSEHNSGGSVNNYRTYHKSWGVRRNDIPVIDNGEECLPHPLDDEAPDPLCVEANEMSEDENEPRVVGKPKIVKPLEDRPETTVIEEEIKAVRGRRKPLFSKSNIGNKVAPKSIKPVKTMTSNLVKNVTSTLKNGAALKSAASRQYKTAQSRPPTAQSVVSSGYGSRSISNKSSPKTSPARGASSKNAAGAVKPNHSSKGTPSMERQGTFTKDDTPPSTTSTTKPSSKIPTPASAATTTKIPAFGSKIAKAVGSHPPRAPPVLTNKPPAGRNAPTKSASSDRADRGPRAYNRSTSADSRDATRRVQASPSTQSLKASNGVAKKSSIPSLAQRSSSNSSLNSNGSGGAKKQVTSKIASLWKKIEDSKKQPPKKDSRVWIQAEPDPEPETPRLIRSNTFDNKDGVLLRNANSPPSEGSSSFKRISRLGSFVVMDENGFEMRLPQETDSGS